MFILKSKLGNDFVIAKNENRRDELIKLGYEVVEDRKAVTLDKMKKEELEKIADERGIDISGAKNNAERVAMIRGCQFTAN